MNTKIINQLKDILTNGKNLTDQAIANYILNNLSAVVELSTVDLAEKCFVSPAGIIRFCQKLGLSGISELKYTIKNLLLSSYFDGFQLSVNTDLKNNQKKFLEEYLAIKEESSKIMNSDFLAKDWSKLINKILTASKVYVFCFNLAYNISRNFVQRLRWINKNVIHENDINAIDSYISLINEKDVVIYISLSGESKYILMFNQQVSKSCYSFAIVGGKGKIVNNCSDFFLLKSREHEIWDVFSIRGQTCVQFLDYLYSCIITNYFK